MSAQLETLSDCIRIALGQLVRGKPPNLVRWNLEKRIVARLSWSIFDAKAYAGNCWPEIERQAARARPAPRPEPALWTDEIESASATTKATFPSPITGDPMKILNPLAAAGAAKAQPAPAPVAETPPPAAEPKPKPAKGDLAAILAAALAGHLPSADLDEARVIALIREHGGTPAPMPGLVLTKPDSEPVKYDKPIHAYAPLLIALIDAKVPVYLWSGSGTSKTRLVEACAEMLKLTYFSDSYTRGMGRAEILGFRDAHGNPVETQLSQAFVQGGLYLADEGDTDGIGIIALNRALANDHAVFAGRLLAKHADFRMCFAANTNGSGQANGYRREPIDAALLDRLFVIELPVDARLEHQAAGIGGKVPKAPECFLDDGGTVEPEEWAKIVRAYREAAQQLSIGTPLTTSGRALWIGAHLARRSIGKRWLVDGLIRKSRPQDIWAPWTERAEGKL